MSPVQTSKSMRRLAKDQGSLHTAGLPPNYLFAPSKEDSFADLTSLSVLLAGPDGTPFISGVFQLELNIPTTYPEAPPTAHFRTKIFHPNVDPATGAVCVDTLKRDWKPELTLRDVLITISCLLVCPNPASALNAEAGQLMEEDFKEYERKAQLWAKMHAAVPAHMRYAVEEARSRGEVESVMDGKARAAKGKKKKDDGVHVIVQEIEADAQDDVENPQVPVSRGYFVRKAASRKSVGLGLGMSMESSVLTDIDTPTQPPPRRRKYEFVPPAALEENQPSAVPILSTGLSTPTPQRSELSHTSTANAENAPEAKRQRVTTPAGKPQSSRSPDEGPDVPSWFKWDDVSSDTSPEESQSAKGARKISEYRRLKAVGFCMKRYNSGQFGPRRGIERL